MPACREMVVWFPGVKTVHNKRWKIPYDNWSSRSKVKGQNGWPHLRHSFISICLFFAAIGLFHFEIQQMQYLTLRIQNQVHVQNRPKFNQEWWLKMHMIRFENLKNDNNNPLCDALTLTYDSRHWKVHKLGVLSLTIYVPNFRTIRIELFRL